MSKYHTSLSALCSSSDAKLRDGTKGSWISAFLYFIDIKDRAGLDAASELNLSFMNAFIGKELFPNLCFVINNWSISSDMRGKQEAREKVWVSELNRRFPGARIERLHYEHPHASETMLKKISNRDREVEQGKYKNSTLGLVKLALKTPAKKRTLLEKELSVKTLVGQTSLFQAAVVRREEDIEAMKEEGKHDVAEFMREDMQDIGNTKVDDAGDIALARKLAREAGAEIWPWYNSQG